MYIYIGIYVYVYISFAHTYKYPRAYFLAPSLQKVFSFHLHLGYLYVRMCVYAYLCIYALRPNSTAHTIYCVLRL